MPNVNDLLAVPRIDRALETFLASAGEVFRVFEGHDSDCVSYGVEVRGRRFFVKHSDAPRGLASLARAERLHAVLRHRAVPRLRHAFATPRGRALVYDWVGGEVLYEGDGAAGREAPASAHARFRALPRPRILQALDTIFEAHLEIEALGFVAVDLYDGCVIHDFDRDETWLCDLDEYREGPFTLDAERLPGSTRFMAPEEFRHGATIDARTNVFELGRMASVLLPSDTPATRRVLAQATDLERAARHPTVSAFVEAWRDAAK